MISTPNPARDFPQPVSSMHRSSSSAMEEWIERHPAASVLIGLGVGFGAGLCLSCAMKNPSSYFSADESFAEKLGHRVLEAFREAVPPSLRDRFHT